MHRRVGYKNSCDGRMWGKLPFFTNPKVHHMIRPSSVDEQSFRKLLTRNVSLPLGVGVLSAVFSWP